MEFSQSLKKNSDFRAVYSGGRSRANHSVVMYVMPNGTEGNRLGISVSKKVGNSVVRHHLARLVREIYRLNESRFVKGIDLIVVLRVGTADISYHKLESAIMHTAKLHKVIDQDA